MAVRLLSSGLALVASAAVGDAKGPYTIDATKLDRVFDGHGGLSAGASSRLLYDYEEKRRLERIAKGDYQRKGIPPDRKGKYEL